jgi:hypothetical protein
MLFAARYLLSGLSDEAHRAEADTGLCYFFEACSRKFVEGIKGLRAPLKALLDCWQAARRRFCFLSARKLQKKKRALCPL